MAKTILDVFGIKNDGLKKYKCITIDKVDILKEEAKLKVQATTIAFVSQKDLESYLRPNLRKLHLTEAWNVMGYICVEKLGLSPSEWVCLNGKHADSRKIAWDSWTQQHGERMFRLVMNEGLCRPVSQEMIGKDKYEERDRRRHLPWLQRKLLTLKMNLIDARFVYPFSPKYARHMVATTLIHGFLRTIKGQKLKDYHFE